MKKIILLALMLFLCTFMCIGAFAAEKTVYVASSGDDANDGSSYTKAVKTVSRAYALIGDSDGRIVICSYINVGSDCVLPANKGMVTISASDGKNYFPLGTLSFSKSLNLSGDTTFERVKISASGIGYLACGGNNVTFGNKIEVGGTLDIMGGYYATTEMTVADASISNDYTITVMSGTYSHIRGGNRRSVANAPFGNISGNCTVNVQGGEFTARDGETNLTAATGMNSQSGNVTLNISGGEFYGSVYGVGRMGSNSTNDSSNITGNVTINITGGTFGGRKLNEKQEESTAFSGKYSLSLTGGDFARIESINGSSASSINVTEGVKNYNEGVYKVQYTNPLRPGPDPWIIYNDGMYYVVISGDKIIYAYAAPSLDAIKYSETYVLWEAPKTVTEENKMYSKEIWSPELHYVSAEEFGAEYEGWWLYFSADDGANPNHRLYCVKSLSGDPLGPYGSPVTGEAGIPVKMTVDNDEYWAIGQSLLRVNGTTYLTWTSETGRGTTDNHKQDIRIAKLANPYTVIGEGVKICVPEYDWEKHGTAYNPTTGNTTPETVEGATAVYGDNGEIIIIYSASNYTSAYYCLATLTLKEGADPLNKDSWVKSEQPVFSRQHDTYGPGHAAYTTDAAGQRIMVYHAYLTWLKVSRHVFVQPWTLNGTTVDMNGGPYSQSTVLTVSSWRPGVKDVITGFGK